MKVIKASEITEGLTIITDQTYVVICSDYDFRNEVWDICVKDEEGRNRILALKPTDQVFSL